MDYITENWSRFLRETKKESTKKKERDEKRRKKAGMGLLDPWHKDELDTALNTNALYEVDADLDEAEAKKVGPGCKRPGAPFHDEDGLFTDPDIEKKGSWSCPEKGQTSRRGRSLRFTKIPCGRKGKFRCKDGSAKWEEGQDPSPAELEDDDSGRYDLIDKESLRRLIKRELQEIATEYEAYLDDEDRLLETGPATKKKNMLQWCRKQGLMNMQKFLQIQNSFEKSTRGTLNKPEKS